MYTQRGDTIDRSYLGRSKKVLCFVSVLIFICVLSGCRDFDRFDCFQRDSGCRGPSPIYIPDNSISPDSGDGTASLEEVPDMSPGAQGEDMRREVHDLGDMRGIVGDMIVHTGPDRGLDISLEESDQFSTDSCTDLTLTLPAASGRSSLELHWTCLDALDPSRFRPGVQPLPPGVQIMTAEMSILQARRLWRNLLGQCNYRDNHLLCEERVAETTVHRYGDHIQQEIGDRFSEDVEGQEILSYLLHTPITDISPNEIQRLVNELNAWATPQHPYRYRLPCHSLWLKIHEQATQPELYNCSTQSNPAMRAVFKGGENNSNGCSYHRPRSVISHSGGVQCSDMIWRPRSADGMMRDFSMVEDRLYLESLPLCDFHGNVREVLTDCPGRDYCTFGNAWNDHRDLANVQNQMDNDSNDDDVGFRLIRYPANLEGDVCP